MRNRVFHAQNRTSRIYARPLYWYGADRVSLSDETSVSSFIKKGSALYGSELTPHVDNTASAILYTTTNNGVSFKYANFANRTIYWNDDDVKISDSLIPETTVFCVIYGFLPNDPYGNEIFGFHDSWYLDGNRVYADVAYGVNVNPDGGAGWWSRLNPGDEFAMWTTELEFQEETVPILLEMRSSGMSINGISVSYSNLGNPEDIENHFPSVNCIGGIAGRFDQSFNGGFCELIVVGEDSGYATATVGESQNYWRNYLMNKYGIPQ